MRRSPRMIVALGALAALAACGSAPAGNAQTHPATTARPAAASVKLTKLGDFDSPLGVVQPPGEAHRLFVVEQTGEVAVIRDGRTLSTPFLDIRALVRDNDEQGLLSMAFAPDYQKSGRFYVFYTGKDGNERVVEYRRGARADQAEPHSARLVLFQRDPESNHNGGLLLFGPDKLLYIGVGDGGSEGDPHGKFGNGQNLGTLFGKILRINPVAAKGHAYTVPKDNPFVHKRGARSEIYSYGLRNPWRFSFDRKTGAIAIADVGQDTLEEVDWRPRGKAGGVNFGWREWEGTRLNDPTLHIHGDLKPVLVYSHDGGNCSITGGYVVRDPRIPALAGRYVYGDYCAGNLLTAKLRLGHATARGSLHLHVSSLTAFGQDNAGRVYATSGDGPVYRLDPR